jgi:hypothetical protein
LRAKGISENDRNDKIGNADTCKDQRVASRLFAHRGIDHRRFNLLKRHFLANSIGKDNRAS